MVAHGSKSCVPQVILLYKLIKMILDFFFIVVNNCFFV